jgi:RIO-like serine/threonine protein kinase
MDYHPSEPITRLKSIQPNWSEFYQHLSKAIEQIHLAGVAHNDLRNPTNTLITPDGNPILVDLVACFIQGHRWNFINQWVFQKFCQVDRSAITKMKQRTSPDLLTDDDLQAGQIAGRFGTMIRGLGQSIRRFSRLLFTKK